MNTYLVATIKDWNIRNFYKIASEIKANWHLITNREDLTLAKIKPPNPRYIFFPHWSWIIPKEVYSNFESVVFDTWPLIRKGKAPRIPQNLEAGTYHRTRDVDYCKEG